MIEVIEVKFVLLTFCMMAVPYQQNIAGEHIAPRKPNMNFKILLSLPHVCKKENI
jgi:hypothetical protein